MIFINKVLTLKMYYNLNKLEFLTLMSFKINLKIFLFDSVRVHKFNNKFGRTLKISLRNIVNKITISTPQFSLFSFENYPYSPCPFCRRYYQLHDTVVIELQNVLLNNNLEKKMKQSFQMAVYNAVT